MAGFRFRNSLLSKVFRAQAGENSLFVSRYTFLSPVVAFLLVNLASCGKPEQRAELVQPLDRQDNVAASSRGARAIGSSSQTSFPVSNLNDDTTAAWGAAEGQQEIYAAVVLPSPQAIQEFRIWLFSPNQPPRPHLRDIRVVAAENEEPNGPVWQVVRSRLSKRQAFSEKVTVPPLEDGVVVLVEIDRSDPHWGPHKIWGFVCFSASRGDAPNYLSSGTGVYVRELQMK